MKPHFAAVRNFRASLLVAALLGALAPALPIFAGAAEAFDPVAAKRGEQVVEQWCRGCHLRARDRPDPDMALSYERIVKRPNHDRAFFETFLKEDHFPMTTFRLFDNEKADVVEYLLSLKQE